MLRDLSAAGGKPDGSGRLKKTEKRRLEPSAKKLSPRQQLVQARDGADARSAGVAFKPEEIETLEAVNPRLEGKTAKQKNPHPQHSLAWAAWIVARLGG